MDRGFDASFQRELSSQTWVLYGIGVFVIVLRTFARWQRVRSVTLFDADDWLMITLVPAFYTALIVCLNVIAAGGGSNLYPPEQFIDFTDEDIQERIKGSKIVIISEQAMLNVIWTLKACMLFMFARMTAGTKYHKWITYLSIYVILGWIAVEVTFFTACRPFSGYWGVPPPNSQCTTYEHYAMVQAVFNISSDFFMLLVPIPMLMALSLPTKKKCVLAVVFSMGIFVIIAAILTKVYNLSDIYSPVYMLWYTREASVAVYVANLPGIWPLLREHISFLRSHLSSYAQNNGTAHPQSQYGNLSSVHRTQRSNHHRSKHAATVTEDEIELGRTSFSKSTSRSIQSHVKVDSDEERLGSFARQVGTRRGSLESDERVLNDIASTPANGTSWLEVHVDRTIEVWRGRVGEGGSQERFKWEVETQAPKVRIEGPEGEVGVR